MNTYSVWWRVKQKLSFTTFVSKGQYVFHVQLSRATVTAPLGHLIGLQSCQYSGAEEQSIYRTTSLPWATICPILWVAMGPSSSYQQVSKRLAKSMLNSEIMDNFTALNTSYLCITFGTNLMHASPCAYGFFVFFPAFFYKFMLFEFWVKDYRRDY